MTTSLSNITIAGHKDLTYTCNSILESNVKS